MPARRAPRGIGLWCELPQLAIAHRTYAPRVARCAVAEPWPLGVGVVSDSAATQLVAERITFHLEQAELGLETGPIGDGSALGRSALFETACGHHYERANRSSDAKRQQQCRETNSVRTHRSYCDR